MKNITTFFSNLFFKINPPKKTLDPKNSLEEFYKGEAIAYFESHAIINKLSEDDQIRFLKFEFSHYYSKYKVASRENTQLIICLITLIGILVLILRLR